MTDKGREVAPVVHVSELLPVCCAPGCSVIARAGEVMCDGHAIAQRILAAQRKLAEFAPTAAEQLIHLSKHAQSEETRRRADEAILDRAGIRPGVDVNVTSSEAGVNPAEILRERMALLRQRTLDASRSEALE